MTTSDERRARVERIVAIGGRIADREDPLGIEARRDLRATSGLSIEGIELALSEHLETEPTRAELDALVASCAEAPRCHVVLAANVCTAALRALAVAVATSKRVALRPSRRDPILASLLSRELTRDAGFLSHGGEIALVAEVSPKATDELHVYGSDAAVASLSAAAERGVVVRAHGTGLGLAIIGVDTSIEEAALALAGDVVPFDQRGCLSPRAALVEGSRARAEAFADALDRALTRLGERVPRGPLDPETEAAIAMYAASLDAVGASRVGPQHAVGFDPEPRALVLPPAARVVHVVPASAEQIEDLVGPWARYLTVIGGDTGSALGRALARRAPRARRALLGAMQRPPLDGPVDLRAWKAPL